MRFRTLTFLALAAWLSALAQDAAPPPPGPKGASVVGTVASRQGACVVVTLDKAAKTQLNEELAVGRPALLITVAKGKERLEAWDEWQEAGRIKIRLLRAGRCAIAVVTKETARIGVGGELAPNIRPGDVVYRSPGVRPAASKANTPRLRAGR